MTDAAGIDRGWESAAYTAFLAAGFVDVTAQLYARSTPAGTTGHDLLATYVRQLRTPMLDTGLVSESMSDPGSWNWSRYLLFVQRTPSPASTWGRRPFSADPGDHDMTATDRI